MVIKKISNFNKVQKYVLEKINQPTLSATYIRTTYRFYLTF